MAEKSTRKEDRVATKMGVWCGWEREKYGAYLKSGRILHFIMNTSPDARRAARHGDRGKCDRGAPLFSMGKQNIKFYDGKEEYHLERAVLLEKIVLFQSVLL